MPRGPPYTNTRDRSYSCHHRGRKEHHNKKTEEGTRGRFAGIHESRRKDLHSTKSVYGVKPPTVALRLQTQLDKKERISNSLATNMPTMFPADSNGFSKLSLEDPSSKYTPRRVVERNHGEGVSIRIDIPNIHGETRKHRKTPDKKNAEGYACVIPSEILSMVFGNKAQRPLPAFDTMGTCRKYLAKDRDVHATITKAMVLVLRNPAFERATVVQSVIALCDQGSSPTVCTESYFLSHETHEGACASMYALDKGGILYFRNITWAGLGKEGPLLGPEDTLTHAPVSGDCDEITKTSYSSLFKKKLFFDPPSSPWETEGIFYDHVLQIMRTVISKAKNNPSFWDDGVEFLDLCKGVSQYVGLAFSGEKVLKEWHKPEIYAPYLPVIIHINSPTIGKCHLIPFIRLKDGRSLPFFAPCGQDTCWDVALDAIRRTRCLAMALIFSSLSSTNDTRYSWVYLPQAKATVNDSSQKKMRQKRFFLPSHQTLARVFWVWGHKSSSAMGEEIEVFCKQPRYSFVSSSLHGDATVVIPDYVHEGDFRRISNRNRVIPIVQPALPSDVPPAIEKIVEETVPPPPPDVKEDIQFVEYNWKRGPPSSKDTPCDELEEYLGLTEYRSDDERNYDDETFPPAVVISEPVEVCVYFRNNTFGLETKDYMYVY